MGTSERLLVYIAFCCSLTLVQIASVSTATISPPDASTQVTSSTNQSTATSQVSNSTVASSTTSTPSKTTTATTAATTTAGSTSAQTTQQAPQNTTLSPTIKHTTTAKSPSLSTSLASSTTSPTTAASLTTSVTEPTTTTETPSLGGKCTGKPTGWCNSTIDGAAVCLNGTCQCQAGHFQSDQSTCILESSLDPVSIEFSNINSTSLQVSWTHDDSVKNLKLEYNVRASITDTDADPSQVNCQQQQGDQNYLCSPLLPGYMYEVEITVTFNDTHSRTGSKNESLYPSKPGQLDKAASNLTYPDVTLIWDRSEGRVDYYYVQVFKNESGKKVFNDTSNDTTVHVPSLDPVTDYYITIIANSYAKPSDIRTDTFSTLYSAPDPVTNVTVMVLNETAVNVSWIVSKENPPTSLYEVTTNNLVDSATSNQSCLVKGSNVTHCIVTGLEEYWMYSFNVLVSALNTTSSQTESDNITTWEAEPGRITNASFELFNSPSNCDATKVKILWEEPALYDRNSKIVKYSFDIMTMNLQSTEFTVPDPDPYSTDNRKFEKEITELKSESTYNTTIYAISSNDHLGQHYTLIIRTDVCAPPDWSPLDLNAVTMQSSSTSSVTIQLPNGFFSKTEQGRLQEIGFIVLPRESKYFDGVQPINLENINDWHNSKNYEFTKEFRVKVKVTDITNGMFKIGSDCTSNRDYCNGPLPEQFSFKVAAYACTRKTLCRVARPIGPYVTKVKQIDNGSSPSGLVIGLSVVMVLLAACAAFTFLWYKDYIHPGSWFSRKNNDGDDDSFTSLDRIVKNRPIKVCNYVPELDEMHKDTNLILSDQYDDINKLGQIIAENSTTNAARHENNTPKNRWVNILPFDHSRVKLQQLDEDDPTTDYINANYMPGFHNQREYIATQGPLPGTIDDFWRMVWEHGVMVIVMLTQCKEGNRVKCEKYWPDELREPKQYGDVVVNPTSISQLDKYNISIFDVSVNDETRQVIHFHYLDFPDFSANVEFDHFINFVRTVRSHVPHDMKGPMVIHCSAGVGRTGTFIATDRLHLYLSSDQFSEEDEVDIFGIVLSLRENRVAMVQTESQFIMIHDCFEKMLEEKRAALKMTDSGENLYENQGFDQTHPGSHPFPETLYENVSSQEQTEL